MATRRGRADGSRATSVAVQAARTATIPADAGRSPRAVVDRRRRDPEPRSCSRRWRASACRRSAARDAASAPGSSAPRWSSCAGIQHRNERTLGYLRVASDEHPLAIQIFGSEPAAMAEAARMVEAAGADIVDINFGCPVRKVTKTGAGATLLDDPDRACAASSRRSRRRSPLPVSVKMRRGLENGSRTCLEVGPRLVEAGAATLTLHPRSARQMYTGTADHSLTAELVVARRRAGDRLGRRHLARAGAGGARDDRRGGGDGRPRRAGQPVGAARDHGRATASRRARRSPPS